MTYTDAKTQITTIKDTLAANIPALLATAGLTDFDYYAVNSPVNAEDTALCVYISRESFFTDQYEFTIVIQAQLFGEIAPEEYHAVLFPGIIRNITPQLLGLETLDSIESDIYPIDRNTGGSFIFYDLNFQSNTDDCDL